MSLTAILDRIRAVGDAQVLEIRGQAECQAENILARAQVDADQAYQASYRRALEPEAGECARILNQARFEAVCLAGQARETFVQAVLDDLRRLLADARCTTAYAPAMRGILIELLPGMDGHASLEERLILEADPRDRQVIETLLADLGLSIRIEYSLSCWGGLIARSPDRASRMVNTLESRLEQSLPYLTQQLAARFEQEAHLEEEQRQIENQPRIKA